MTDNVPQYVEERIRRAVPADSTDVPGTAPVVSVGNAETSQVATPGLNPGRVEFLNGSGIFWQAKTTAASGNTLGE